MTALRHRYPRGHNRHPLAPHWSPWAVLDDTDAQRQAVYLRSRGCEVEAVNVGESDTAPRQVLLPGLTLPPGVRHAPLG